MLPITGRHLFFPAVCAPTAVSWLKEFTLNLTTTGTQTRPRITQLANGTILVVWDSRDNSGAGTGLDTTYFAGRWRRW